MNATASARTSISTTFVQNMTVFSYHQADKVPVQRIQARPDVCRERGMAADVFVPRAAAVGVRRGGAYRPGGPEDAHAIRRSVGSVCSAAGTRNGRGWPRAFLSTLSYNI